MMGISRRTILFFLSGFALTNTPVQGIPLLGGQYETATDVQSLLNLALDAAAMKETTSLAAKEEIYKNGVPRDGGNEVTLQSLSLEAKERMSENPMFNIFRHAFLVLGQYNEHETEGSFDTKPISQYADTIVNDLFALEIKDIETEAALVMNVWMVVIHELFQVAEECKAGNYQKGIGALDRAAALWIGEGQVPGSNDEGHLLYSLTEKAGERFDQDDGETKANTEIMSLFHRMQENLINQKCGTPAGYIGTREDVFNMIKWMTVPLIQNLIHHTKNVQNEDGSNFVELYALATIPRVAACDPSAYDVELNLNVLRELNISYRDDALQALQRAYSCFAITCDDLGTYKDEDSNECTDPLSTTMAGYTTTREVARDNSRTDRDILEIDIFLKFEAYGAALDWYHHGWNGVFSLRELAKNLVVPSSTDSLFTVYKDFYDQNNDFADNYIMNVLEQIPPFNSASPAQIRELITGTMKHTVMFLSSVSSLQFAVDQCDSQNAESAQSYWDDGVAFFVGSIEGPNSNGDKFGGEFLFSTSKELCGEFETCVGSGDAPTSSVNEDVMSAFADGIVALNSASCGVARGILNDRILPAMMIPLIQGTIKYASFNKGLQPNTQDASLAIGDAFARAAIPLVNQGLPTSAQTIQTQMEFQLTSQPVPGGFAAVADAFRQALPAMATDCADIGAFIDEPVDGDLCGGDLPAQPTAPTPVSPPVQAPVTPTGPTAPADIAFGRYTFSNLDVADGDGSFALDVRDMFNAGNIDAAKNIYLNGANAYTTGLSLEAGLVSLSSLSTQAATFMYEDPMFNIFKYALYNDEDLEDTSGEDFLYADDLIREALNNARDNKLAAEGAVVVNVWMLILHRLNQAVVECRNSRSAQNFLDSAVALWIGKEQGEAKFDHGWMLYSVGQSAAKFYGLDDGEAPVNTQLMNLFLQAQTDAQTCESDSKAHIHLRLTVLNLWRGLTKPLILQLLFHMVQNSKNMVEMYAVAVVPQSAACDLDANAALQSALFQGYNKDQSLSDDLVGHMATFLRCQRMTCQDLQHTPAADSKLIDLVQQICSKLNYYKDAGDKLPMAGYEPQTDVRETARLDLDVLEIEIYTRTQAYKAALDVYRHGHNSFSDANVDQLHSLKQLTSAPELSTLPQFQNSVDFFGKQQYADDVITSILQRTGDYAVASRGQRAELVVRALQTMVSFMSILGFMYKSSTHCNAGEDLASAFHWDKAAALYVGSIAGLVAGGQDDGDGYLLYSLANEVCDEFDTCEASSEASTNEQILTSFAGGREAVDAGLCEQLTRQIENEILPRMIIPLVQGTLKFALDYENAPAREADSVGTAHMIAKAVIPLINAVNSTSAATLDQEFGSFRFFSAGTADTVIFEAFAYALRGLGISCEDLGKSKTAPGMSLCIPVDNGQGGSSTGEVPVPVPLPDSPTNLGDDLYVTTTYVQDRANIAIDIKDMEVALEGGAQTKEMAELIYKNGQNSEIYDENGKFVSFRSLKQFSADATLEMVDDPLFNIYMYALQDSDGTFMAKETRLYADTLVAEAFELVSATEKTLPAEAAVALNLWMYIVHLLHQALDSCKNKEIKEDDGVHAMDVAVAYWIGDGQVAGSADRGHLLYALAEEMGDNFSTAGTIGESRANTNILRLFNEAKNEIALPGACSDNPGTFIRLRNVVNRLVPQMAIPLIQALIHNLRANDRARVKIYATAVVPMFAGCSESTFLQLKEKLIHMNYNVVEVEDIVALLGSAYSCLGLQCDDIGVHTTEAQADEAPACNADDILRPLAGYRPASDVREFARLDLDFRHLDILTQMKAYKAATDLYLHGQHVRGVNGGSLSLSHLATTSERSVVPSFDAFVRYYDTDSYADTIIRAALSGSDPNWNDAQRRVVALKSAQVMVMYFAALQFMYEAVSDCSSTSSVRSVGKSDSWDKAAAVLIGHLEGSKTNGTMEGYMYYELAQEHCEEFGTCVNQNEGVAINNQLVSLLYSGRGAVLGNSCQALRKAADEVATLLLIPQIQGALSTAIRLSGSSDQNHLLNRAEAYVYSRALLPLVDDANRAAATTIDNQLGVPGPNSKKNTASDVFRSLAMVYPTMNVDCELVGESAGFDACTGVEYDTGLSKSTMWIIISACLAVCLCACCSIVLRSRRAKAGLPENNPRFTESGGEFNNHSMDLLEKAFSNHTGPRMQTSPETVALTEDLHTDASPPEDDDFEEATALQSRMMSAPDII